MSQNHSSAGFLLLKYDLVGQTDDFQSLPAMLFCRIMMELASRMSQNHSSAGFLLLKYDLVGQTDDFQSLPAMLFRPIMMELASRMSQNLQISPPPLHSPSENSKSQTKVEYAVRGGERAGVCQFLCRHKFSSAKRLLVSNKSNLLKIMTR